MKILAVETSCDETAIAILRAEGDDAAATFTVLGNALLSQIEIHREFGGVFPAVAKREHAKNLVPILEAALAEAEMLHEDTQAMDDEVRNRISALLEREPGLTEAFFDSIPEMEVPDIDAIAVTAGPGLEPALWVGVNFAKALSVAWNKPLIAVNHMEGHTLAALLTETAERTYSLQNVQLPLLALLISGGHTELVVASEWLSYQLVGQTRDDAVGEAFDKVARMLGLPYPGGPEVSKLAEKDREDAHTDPDIRPFTLPRPMIDSPDCDFSFSGLKTAVLYLIKERGDLSEQEKEQIAREFEDAVGDVLFKKVSRALEDTNAQTLAIGGGVSANTHIQRLFRERMAQEHPEVSLRIPRPFLTSDNAIMIGVAGYFRYLRNTFADVETLRADGNRTLAGE